MESTSYKQTPNPNAKRGFRVSWSLHPTQPHFAYLVQNNVVIRDFTNPNNNKALVYTDFMSKVTCVQYSPNGNYLAAGDDKGKVRIFSYNIETREIVVKKEHSMVAGAVLSIAWTDDGQRIAAAGEGKDAFAKAVLAESGTKVGDLFGPTKTINSIDLKPKPYRLIMAGEGYEIYAFDGVPFKHFKTIQPHTNFINKIAYNQDGQQFVSVSSDKSIIVFDTATLDVVQKIEKAHGKGIMDVAWLDSDSLITISSDNLAKVWSVKEGKETLTLNVGETEVLENQQLGLLVSPNTYATVTLNSNIHFWDRVQVNENGQRTPQLTVQGHSNNIQALVFANGNLISADQDGKIFSWGRTDSLRAELIRGQGHTTVVSHLASHTDFVLSGSVDGTIFKSQHSGDGIFEYKQSVKLDGFPISLSPGSDNNLYVLQSNNKLAIIDISSFTVTKVHEFKDYEATALAFANSTVWVGDKKGLLHVLSASDLSEQAVIEKKHNHAISYIRASQDGSLVASGDAYRYIYVFDHDTRTEVNCFTYHTSKITQLEFSNDKSLLLTASLDLGVGVANLADKTKRLMHRTNEKELTAVVFDDANRVYTAGYDCSIRQWSL